MCGFDFDFEVVVWLCWVGVWLICIDVLVCYFGWDEGGVLYFYYGCDNVLFVWMYLCLFVGFVMWLLMLVVWCLMWWCD